MELNSKIDKLEKELESIKELIKNMKEGAFNA
jgi:outer membrane murein-binding lipoprotein Lpp